jgi:hypothetical protein
MNFVINIELKFIKIDYFRKLLSLEEFKTFKKELKNYYIIPVIQSTVLLQS